MAALGAGPQNLMNDLRTFGYLFETMAVRDLRCYAQALDGWVSHYHDGSGLECDAVIHLRDGAYGLVEIKLGGNTLIAEGVRNLNEFNRKIDTTRMSAPAFRMVLVANGEFAYCRKEDGIIVCPISALRP